MNNEIEKLVSELYAESTFKGSRILDKLIDEIIKVLETIKSNEKN